MEKQIYLLFYSLLEDIFFWSEKEIKDETFRTLEMQQMIDKFFSKSFIVC